MGVTVGRRHKLVTKPAAVARLAEDLGADVAWSTRGCNTLGQYDFNLWSREDQAEADTFILTLLKNRNIFERFPLHCGFGHDATSNMMHPSAHTSIAG